MVRANSHTDSHWLPAQVLEGLSFVTDSSHIDPDWSGPTLTRILIGYSQVLEGLSFITDSSQLYQRPF